MEDIWEHNTSSFQDRKSHLRKRHFPIPGPPKGRSLTLLEDPTGRFAVGTTGAVLWPAATALVEYLDGQVKKSCLNFRCVELGAGVGAVGLFMALHKGCEVTLTEVPEQLQLLGLNVSENSPTGLDLQVAPLTWGDQEQMEVLGTFEMVVGSDVSYRPQCIGELLSTAERLLAPGGRVVFSLQDRPGEADLLESSLKSLAVSKRQSVMAKSLEGEEDVPVIIFELRRPTEMQPREAPKAAGDVEDEFFRLTGIRPDPVVIPKKEKPKEPPPEPPRPSFKERVVRDLLDRQHTRSPPRAPSHPDLHMAKKRRRGAEGVAAEVEAEDVQDVQPQPRRKAKRKKAAMPESAAKDDGCLAPSTARAFEEPTRKAKRKKAVKVQPAAKATEFSAEAQAVMEELTDPASKGTLSDRLNPTHPRYDKQLKARWKSFSKKERAAIVECDKNKMKATVSAAVSIQHPFATNEDDHCETALEAYRDVLPILQHIASLLGKAPSKLRIYDPFYCAGAVVKHLGELGFPHVYNKCEDFYAVNEEGRVPKHDVLLTNPPYSGEHVEYLLRFCRSNAKPFLLLMPNYFCSKDFYDDALGGTSQSVLYLCPRKRYFYWTPKGLRTRSKVQSQHAGEGGNRTSPFISFWYIDLSPLMSAKALMRWWQETRGGEGSKLCRRPDLPRSCQP
ncbi:EEF1AKMT3 [Symbiodinium sp. KB8]|nr:EEF1AKMT3 [Symbiodinium sp. KB8]